MLDSSTRAFWEAVRRGTFIRISDLQALTASRHSGKGLEPVQYLVRKKTVVEQYDTEFRHKLASTWMLFELDGPEHTENTLYVRIVRDDEEDIIDVGLFYCPPEFMPDTRKELVENGYRWIFETPEDPDNFDSNDCRDLEFTKTTNDNMPSFKEMVEGKEVETLITFKRKKMGTQYGIQYKGGTKIPFMFTEYSAVEEYKNPRFIITEEAFLDENGGWIPAGGVVTLLFGCSVELGDIEVI